MFSIINFIRMPREGWMRDRLHREFVTLVDFVDSSQMGHSIEDDIVDALRGGGALHCQVEHHVQPKKNLLLVSCITKMSDTFGNLFS